MSTSILNLNRNEVNMQIKYIFLITIFMLALSIVLILNTANELTITVREKLEVHPSQIRLTKIERVAEIVYLCLKLVFFLIVLAFCVALLAAIVLETR